MPLYDYENPDYEAQIANEFWAKEKKKAERDAEIEQLHRLNKYDAILKDIWTQPEMELYGSYFIFPTQNLDEWLAEDTYMREVDDMCNSISIF